MADKFVIKILRQNWIEDNGLYSEVDLCSHGELFLQVGDEILSNSKSGSWTLSASGLFLLRTLYEDHKIGDFGNFLVPCCANTIVFDKDKNRISLIGCNNGIDWKIKHINNFVKISTIKGSKVKIPTAKYREIILSYIKQIEDFYADITLKTFDNEYEREMYQKFWKEWNELKRGLIA